MFRILAPILIVPTAEARQALGRRLRIAGLATYQEIAIADCRARSFIAAQMRQAMAAVHARMEAARHGRHVRAH